MPDQDIFNSDNNQEQNTGATTPSSTDIFADKLKTIVNENGEPKYKTVEDALEALNHSQQFIETLKAEKAQSEADKQKLASELETRESVEDVVKRLTTNETPKPNSTDDNPREDKGLTEDRIQELVQNALRQNQTVAQKTTNLNTVVENLSNTYGDKTTSVVAERAKEVGTTPDQLKKLAEDNPQLVLSLFKDVKVNNTTPTQSSTVPRTTPPPEEGPPKSDKKLITGGASNAEVMDAWRKTKEYTHKTLGVES